MRPAMPLGDRLWSRVDKTGGCWLWLGSGNEHGYGQIRDEQGRNVMVHRVAYELEVGPIPSGLELDHLCRVRNCVNPAHLEPVTHRENMRRGLSPSTVNAGKTRCVHGHPLEGENLHIETNGARRCRTCNAANQAAFRARQKEAECP